MELGVWSVLGRASGRGGGRAARERITLHPPAPLTKHATALCGHYCVPDGSFVYRETRMHKSHAWKVLFGFVPSSTLAVHSFLA